jgi:hypothetical protein
MGNLVASMLPVRTFRAERSFTGRKTEPPRYAAIFAIEFEVDSRSETLR